MSISFQNGLSDFLYGEVCVLSSRLTFAIFKFPTRLLSSSTFPTATYQDTTKTVTSPIQDKSMQKRRRPTEDTKQQTIQDLFSTTKLAEPPKHKRQKLSNESSPATYQETLPATSMYSFPARNKQNAPNVVDLTDSPTASPSPRKPLKPARNTYNPNLGAKKIIVKNLRTASSSDPQQYFEQIWQKLDVSLDSIFGNRAIPYSMEELYRGAENVCRQGHSADLCGRVEEKAHTYAGHVQQLILKNIDSASTVVLQDVVNAWSTWSKQMVGTILSNYIRPMLMMRTGSSATNLLLHGSRIPSPGQTTFDTRDGCDNISTCRV